MTRVEETLRKAKRLVAKGWCKGRGVEFDKYGVQVVARCASTAITDAARSTAVDEKARNIFSKAIKRKDIPAWNDAKRRTQKDVLDAFDKAIKLAG